MWCSHSAHLFSLRRPHAHACMYLPCCSATAVHEDQFLEVAVGQRPSHRPESAETKSGQTASCAVPIRALESRRRFATHTFALSTSTQSAAAQRTGTFIPPGGTLGLAQSLTLAVLLVDTAHQTVLLAECTSTRPTRSSGTTAQRCCPSSHRVWCGVQATPWKSAGRSRRITLEVIATACVQCRTS
jgi:hypothetical protein